jgi:hypothetical protein
MSDAHINEDLVREIFRRYALAADGDERVTAPTLPPRTQAQMNAFADAMRDAFNGAAARDSVGFGAAFDQGRQVASGMDLNEIINSVHVPEDAGEHEEALLRLLLRIPDGWGRWISCSSRWFALLAREERELADACPTFAAHQIKEKYGTLRLYVEFDHDDDLPTELRAAEPRCPSFEVLAGHLGTTGAGRDGPVGNAWQDGYETIFVPAHEEWSARVAVFRESDAGMRAAEGQARRSAAFERLVEQFEQESTTTCDAAAATACSPAPRRAPRGTPSGATSAATPAGSSRRSGRSGVAGRGLGKLGRYIGHKGHKQQDRDIRHILDIRSRRAYPRSVATYQGASPWQPQRRAHPRSCVAARPRSASASTRTRWPRGSAAAG